MICLNVCSLTVEKSFVATAEDIFLNANVLRYMKVHIDSPIICITVLSALFYRSMTLRPEMALPSTRLPTSSRIPKLSCPPTLIQFFVPFSK